MQPKSAYHVARVRDLIAEGEHSLCGGPHPERARRDAETLFLHVLQESARHDDNSWIIAPGIAKDANSAWLAANGNTPTNLTIGARLKALIERRRAGEPIQYILEETEFYGLPFHVTRDVLIPRPETEHLVEKTIALATDIREPRIVDVGTGSGCIAVALAHHLPNARVTAIDLSAAALAIARKNAKQNNVADRIRFLGGDLLLPVAGERFDFVVSNPPYVANVDRELLSVEVRDFEPAMALFAGSDGLDVYSRLIPSAFDALNPGGFLLLEIGYGQSPAIGELLTRSGFQQIEFIADLQGIPRVACARRP